MKNLFDLSATDMNVIQSTKYTYTIFNKLDNHT